MAVGAPTADNPNGRVQWGAVYLYRRARSGSWLLQTELYYPDDFIQARYPETVPSNVNVRPKAFGSSVALAGDLLVVGVRKWTPASHANPDGSLIIDREDRGGAFFYRHTGARTWEPEQIETVLPEHSRTYW
jgi:hypothetical protein